MKDSSKILIQEIVSKAKQVDLHNRKANGSLEVKISNDDIKKILGRKRIKEGLKDSLIKDFKYASISATRCESNSICVVIPKDKLEKNIIQYSEINQYIKNNKN